jgi:general secretion pathway protein C
MISTTLQRADILQWLQSRHISRITALINVLLVIWLASMLANLSWKLLTSTESEPVGGETAIPEMQAPVVVDQVTIAREVADWHLFGVPAQESAPVAEVPVDAPDTRLDLVLHGTILSPDPLLARAIVAGPNGAEDHYSIGDKMPGNTSLSEIHADRVILKRNSRYETLRLPKDDILFGKNATVSPQAGSQGGRTNRRLQSGSVPRKPGNRVASPSTPRVAGRKVAASRKTVSGNSGQTLQALKQNPASLLNVVQPEPVQEGNTFIGFRLKPGQGGSMAQYGLEAGDIVTQINNVKLDSPGKGIKALESLSAGSQVSLMVLRGGEELTVTINVP